MKTPAVTEEVTCLVKTFARPGCLRRLLRSIDARCPGLRAVVVDDSPRPYAERICREEFARAPIEVVQLAPDRGVAAGRNHGLERVRTPYFLLLDDDFVFGPRTQIGRMHQALTGGAWEIVGGACVNVNASGRERLLCWEGDLVRVGTVLVARPLRPTGPVTRCDCVPNFFLARTGAVREIGAWDPELKLLEHTEFFVRAQAAGLRVGYAADVRVDHRPLSPPGYARYRRRPIRRYLRYWMRKHGLSHFVNFAGKVERLPELWPRALPYCPASGSPSPHLPGGLAPPEG